MNYFNESSITKIWIEDEIVHVVFKKDSILSLDLAKDLVKERIEISKFKNYKLYVDIRNLISIDLPARKFLSSEEGTKFSIAAAIHIGNPISKFIGNLFHIVDKPNKPTKLFTNKTQAIKWLKQINN